MRCPFCGTELPAEAAFCANCGAKVEIMEEGAVMQSVPVDAEPAKRKNNALVPVIIVGGIAAAALAVVFIGGTVKDSLGGSSADKKALVYRKEDAYYYVKNMDKEKEAVKICEDAAYGNTVLSKDGTYFYWLDDRKSELCRAELNKLKDDSSKNEAYIIEIEGRVSSYKVLEDGKRVVCRKENDKLVYFDGKDSVDIGKTSGSWYLNEEENCVLYMEESSGNNKLVRYDLASGKDAVLAERVGSFWSDMTEGDFIVYTGNTDGEQGSQLYYTNAAGKDEKIADAVTEVYACNSAEQSLYFVTERKEKTTLYDFFVNDSASNAAATEPVQTDFMEPVTEQEAMSEYDRSYYLEYPEEKEEFYQSLDFDRELNMYSTYNYDDYMDYYYNEQTKQWYRMNWEAYEDAYAAFDNLAYRDELLANMKEEEISRTYYDLYYWTVGKEAVLAAENVSVNSIQAAEDTALLFYQKISPAEASQITLSEVESLGDAWDYYYSTQEDEVLEDTVYYYNGNAENELSENGRVRKADISGNADYVVLTLSDEDAEDRTSICYEWKNGMLENGKEISGDVVDGHWCGNVYYYFDDMIDGYGDLYSYQNGKSERLIRNIAGGVIYKDDNIVCLDDGELEIYSGADDSKKVGRDVQQYTYIDENRIVYRDERYLYVYNGKKEDKKIAKYVDDFWCNGMSAY